VLDSEESLRFEVAWWRARRAGYLLEVHALDGPSGPAYWAVAPSRVAAAEAAVAVLEDISAGRRKWPDAELDLPDVATARS